MQCPLAHFKGSVWLVSFAAPAQVWAIPHQEKGRAQEILHQLNLQRPCHTAAWLQSAMEQQAFLPSAWLLILWLFRILNNISEWHQWSFQSPRLPQIRCHTGTKGLCLHPLGQFTKLPKLRPWETWKRNNCLVWIQLGLFFFFSFLIMTIHRTKNNAQA